MVKRLELYVLRRTLTSVAGALAVIASILFLVDAVELTREIGLQTEVSPVEVAALTLMRSPLVILQLLPFVFLFGVLAAFTSLNRRSELIAMRAAGVSAWRFIMPAAVAAFLIGVGVVTGLNPLATRLSNQGEERQADLQEGYQANQPEEVWLSQGGGRSQTLLHARDRNELGTVLSDVSVRFYVRANDGRPIFVRRIDARRAELTSGAWRLTDAQVGLPGQPAIATPLVVVPTTLDARSTLERFSSPRTVSFWDLPGRIRRTEGAGLSSLRYQLRWHQLMASPVLYAAMSVLAAGFSLRLLRLGGLAGLAAAAVALGFLLFFFDELLSALGSAELVPPWAAAWASPVIALLAGLTLLAFTEDG